MTIAGAQIRSAREQLGWTRGRLATQAGVGATTIRCFELELRTPEKLLVASLQRPLEAAGVVFVEENGEGPGARLQKDK